MILKFFSGQDYDNLFYSLLKVIDSREDRVIEILGESFTDFVFFLDAPPWPRFKELLNEISSDEKKSDILRLNKKRPDIIKSRSYLSKFKEFILLLNKKRPDIIKNVIGKFINDKEDFLEYDFLDEEGILIDYCRCLGAPLVLSYIDMVPLFIKKKIRRYTIEVDVAYVLGEYCYLEKRWVEAFIIFLKIIANYEYEVSNFFEFDWKWFKWWCPEIRKISNLTIEQIYEKSLECLNKAVASGDVQKINDLFLKIIKQSNDYKEELEKKDKERVVFYKFSDVFCKLIEGDKSAAIDKWDEFKNSMGKFKFLGIDGGKITKYLKSYGEKPEGRKTERRELKKILLLLPSVEDFSVISEIEQKMREFIKDNLKKQYRTYENAWRYGIPFKAREECRRSQEMNNASDKDKWLYFDFSHYPEIIKHNWSNIFEKFFKLEKSDAQKSKDEHVKFLYELKDFRNILAHTRRSLQPYERQRLKNHKNLFDNIYKNWKDQHCIKKDNPSKRREYERKRYGKSNCATSR